MRTVAQIAVAVGGEVCGDAAREVMAVAPLDAALADELSFFVDAGHRAALATTRAAAVLVDAGGLATGRSLRGDDALAYVVCQAPRRAMILAADLLRPAAPAGAAAAIHPSAVIDPTALLAADVDVGPLAVVEAGARLGAGVRVGAQAFVGAGAELAAGCVLWPGAKVMAGCRLGERCVLLPGAVVGSLGFGFAGGEGGRRRMPQQGIVTLGDDCEVGANACIDRASFGATSLGRRVKIDNQVQVGHQCRLGDDTVMCSQSGVAGSTTLGARVQVGAQAGIADHLEVADDTRLSARAGVVASLVEPGGTWGGTPAVPHRDWLRSALVGRALPSWRRRLEAVERALAAAAAGARPESDGDAGGGGA